MTRAQLLALGFSAKAITHRVKTARLHPIWAGVYAVGRPELSRHGEFMAAVLACGPGSVLSHSSAAELWEMGVRRAGGAIHVSVGNRSIRGRAGIRVHRRRTLADDDITEHLGIPVTTPVITLIDIAPELDRGAVEHAINEGDKRDLFDVSALRRALDAVPGRAGVRVLRTILDRHTYVMTDSELERRYLPISRRAALPQPETQAWVNGFRVDFYYRALGLVVETDGLRYHRTAAQQAKDRRRDQAHTAAGLTPLRFTHAQVRYEPKYVESLLRSVARRLSAD